MKKNFLPLLALFAYLPIDMDEWSLRGCYKFQLMSAARKTIEKHQQNSPFINCKQCKDLFEEEMERLKLCP